jgi:hypothetical protein
VSTGCRRARKGSPRSLPHFVPLSFRLGVMRIEAGVIAEITTFNAGLFPAFGLPPAL